MKKYILTLVSTFYLLIGFCQSAENPFIFKDTTGKVLTEKEFNEYSTNGASLEKTSVKENGKTVIIVRHTSKGQLEKEKNERLEKLNALLNKPLPEFKLRTLNDKEATLSNYNGKVRVLNFWFVECNPCVREMPELNKLVAAYKNKHVAFLAPSVSYKNKVLTFLKNQQFRYEILPNAGNYIESLSISSFPTHLIIDKKGIVRNFYEGYDEHIVEKLSHDIDTLLLER